MTDKQHITIQIADAGILDLNIERSEEERLRKTVSNVNKLWSTWSKEFPNRSSKDILAMVAFQYARLYYAITDNLAEQANALNEAEKAIDDILLDVK